MSQHLQRAQLLFDTERYELSVQELLLAIAEEPESSVAHSLLAHSLTQLGRSNDALRSAEEGLRLDPSSPFGHYVYSVVLSALDRQTDSKRAIQEAIRLSPDRAGYQGCLGAIFLETQDPSQALAAANAGLAIEATNHLCLHVRIAALLQLGRTQTAVEVAQYALSLDPNDATTHTFLATARERLLDPLSAANHYKTALRLDPTETVAQSGLMRLQQPGAAANHLALRIHHWFSRVPPSFVNFELIVGWITIHATPRLTRSHPHTTGIVITSIAAYILLHIFLYVPLSHLRKCNTPARFPDSTDLAFTAFTLSLAAVSFGILWPAGLIASLLIDLSIVTVLAVSSTAREGESPLQSLFRINPVAVGLMVIAMILLIALHG